MRTLLVIGIGAGNPDFMTVEAIEALNGADAVFVFDKGETKEDLLQLRRTICDRFIADRSYRFVTIEDPVRDAQPRDYHAGVRDWHRERAQRLASQIAAEVGEDGWGAFLVWGDPSLYDSTLRLLEVLRAEQSLIFDYRVIPGISSIQVLAARHRLVLNTIGGSVVVTTGRELAENGFPERADSVVVMLDRGDGLRAACKENVEIFWGAYLGTPGEILRSGRLRDIIGDIEAIRAHEKARRGWIMDTYLLRRIASG